MFKNISTLICMMLLSVNAYATQISYPTVWGVNDTVTNVKLNNNNNAVSNVVNGNLDNGNMATGYALFQTVAALPTAGTQGRVDFLTSDNSLNLDTGAAWVKTITPSGTLATGQLAYYNSGWQLLSPGSQYYSIISNGSSSLPSYQQVNLAQGVTNTLPIGNGGTGQTTAQAAIDALLPSQSGKSGQFLTNNGSASSWGNATWQFISKTSPAVATNSGDITISATKYYFVSIHISALSSADSLSIRFNNDTASHYTYVNRGIDTGATAVNANSAGTTSILMGPAFVTIGGDYYFYIFPQDSTNRMLATGRNWGEFNSSSVYGYSDFFGKWENSAAVTSFRIITTAGNNMTGDINLYQISQQ